MGISDICEVDQFSKKFKSPQFYRGLAQKLQTFRLSLILEWLLIIDLYKSRWNEIKVGLNFAKNFSYISSFKCVAKPMSIFLNNFKWIVLNFFHFTQKQLWKSYFFQNFKGPSFLYCMVLQISFFDLSLSF